MRTKFDPQRNSAKGGAANPVGITIRQFSPLGLEVLSLHGFKIDILA